MELLVGPLQEIALAERSPFRSVRNVMWADDSSLASVISASACGEPAAHASASSPEGASRRGPVTGVERHRHLKLG